MLVLTTKEVADLVGNLAGSVDRMAIDRIGRPRQSQGGIVEQPGYTPPRYRADSVLRYWLRRSGLGEAGAVKLDVAARWARRLGRTDAEFADATVRVGAGFGVPAATIFGWIDCPREPVAGPAPPVLSEAATPPPYSPPPPVATRPWQLIERRCRVCGKAFRPLQSNSTLCGARRCHNRAYRDRYLERVHAANRASNRAWGQVPVEPAETV